MKTLAIVRNQIISLILAKRFRNEVSGLRQRNGYPQFGDVSLCFRIALDNQTSVARAISK